MRDSFEPLIPLNGCKGTTFPVNFQIFGQKSFKVAPFSTSMLPFATKHHLSFTASSVALVAASMMFPYSTRE